MSVFRAATFVLLCQGVTNVFATQIIEMSLEEKSKLSDLVVIGKVASVSSEDCYRGSRCAKILISSVLKGDSKGSITFLFDGPIHEFRPKCCEIGTTYLFFLERIDDARFRSMNGYFGVYSMGVP